MERILVIQHVENEIPGRISAAAEKHGATLEVVETWRPDYKIPDIAEYDGLIILGGPMGVYEDFLSKEDELALIKKAHVLKIPTQGRCLGSQLIAAALGADVHKNMVDGKHVKEIGYYEVSLTLDGLNDPLLNGLPSKTMVLQWHGDAFDLPKGATLLATSPFCRNQAFRVGNIWGLLFHFEFTPQMVRRQIESDKEWVHQDFNFNEQLVIKQAEEFDELMARQEDLVTGNFLEIIRSR